MKLLLILTLTLLSSQASGCSKNADCKGGGGCNCVCDCSWSCMAGGHKCKCDDCATRIFDGDRTTINEGDCHVTVNERRLNSLEYTQHLIDTNKKGRRLLSRRLDFSFSPSAEMKNKCVGKVCNPQNTQVIGRKTYMQISEVTPGDEVWDGSDFTEVLAVTHNSSVYESYVSIVTDVKKLMQSALHMIPLSDGQLVYPFQLNEGDELLGGDIVREVVAERGRGAVHIITASGKYMANNIITSDVTHLSSRVPGLTRWVFWFLKKAGFSTTINGLDDDSHWIKNKFVQTFLL